MFYLLDALFPPREDEKIVRELPPEALLTYLTPQLVSATRPRTVALLPFTEPVVRSAIHEAKYHGSPRALALLAHVLTTHLTTYEPESPAAILVPIPLGTQRRRERGYNQIEEIAKRAVRKLEVTLVPTLLERTRETVSQISLPRRAREENMRGAFKASSPLDPRGTYIVVDDVLTTGATLQAALDALRAAGAEHIVPLALAH